MINYYFLLHVNIFEENIYSHEILLYFIVTLRENYCKL